MGQQVRAFISLYRPQYIAAVVALYMQADYRIGRYTTLYNQTNNFSNVLFLSKSFTAQISVILLTLVALVNVYIAGSLIALSLSGSLPEGWIFGFAFLLLSPVTVAFFAPITTQIAHIFSLLSPKKIGYIVLSRILEAQVERLRATHTFTVVAVAGSVGKTSTKLSIVQTLESAGLRVRSQSGNYNVRLTVPLVFFDQRMPSMFNVAAWVSLIHNNKKIIAGNYPFDVVVVELGTDGPGQMQDFAYLKPDLGVLTAIAPEHMEYFGSLQAVANEELNIGAYSKKLLVNTDDVAAAYLKGIKHISYGLAESSKGYTAESLHTSKDGQSILLFKDGEKYGEAKIQFLGTQGRKIILAAVAVADVLHVDASKIVRALAGVRPFPGRLQQLEGIKNSTILDDTYNAAPSAVEAALNVLEDISAPQKIAILGSMNELGDFSAEAHKTIGSSINPQKIDLVVTIGVVARDYLAPAAVANGCRVISLLNPHEAGLLVKSELLDGAIVLAKGSQNGVFAEEALKPLLKHAKDQDRLVRQSSYWMKAKRKQFLLPKR